MTGSPKLYIKCPNILASMHAQKKLHEVFGFEIIGKEPHYTDRFVVVSPPEYCAMGYRLRENEAWRFYSHQRNCRECGKYKDDKPVICSFPPSMNPDGELALKDDKDWIEMFDALKLITLVTPKI